MDEARPGGHCQAQPLSTPESRAEQKPEWACSRAGGLAVSRQQRLFLEQRTDIVDNRSQALMQVRAMGCANLGSLTKLIPEPCPQRQWLRRSGMGPGNLHF